MSAAQIQAQKQAQKILVRCFSTAEFEFLELQPRFIEATRQFETIEDALHAVDPGQQLIRESWKRVSYPFPSKPITPPRPF